MAQLANEAFHHEVGVWGQRIFRQRRVLLVAKLRVLLFLKLSTFMYRKLHTRAHSQGYIAGIVAAKLAGGCDLKLQHLSDAEYRARQEQELAAVEREGQYLEREKERKTALAVKRGIAFSYPKRGDDRTARAIARGRTFQRRALRSSGRAEQKQHSARSARWRSRVSQRCEADGLRYVSKRKKQTISRREALVATFVAGAGNTVVEHDLQHAGANSIVDCDVRGPKADKPQMTAKKRKETRTLKQHPKEKKVALTPKQRKDAWKLRQQPKEKKATLTPKQRKDAWKLNQQARRQQASEGERQEDLMKRDRERENERQEQSRGDKSRTEKRKDTQQEKNT